MRFIISIFILIMTSANCFANDPGFSTLSLEKESVGTTEIGVKVHYSPRYNLCKIYIDSREISDKVRNESLKPDRTLGEIAEPSSVRFNKLRPDTEYYIYAIVYDRLGSQEEMKMIKIRTEKK